MDRPVPQIGQNLLDTHHVIFTPYSDSLRHSPRCDTSTYPKCHCGNDAHLLELGVASRPVGQNAHEVKRADEVPQQMSCGREPTRPRAPSLLLRDGQCIDDETATARLYGVDAEVQGIYTQHRQNDGDVFVSLSLRREQPHHFARPSQEEQAESGYGCANGHVRSASAVFRRRPVRVCADDRLHQQAREGACNPDEACLGLCETELEEVRRAVFSGQVSSCRANVGTRRMSRDLHVISVPHVNLRTLVSIMSTGRTRTRR